MELSHLKDIYAAACPLISRQLFSNGTSIILVDGIVLCFTKCETETEEQKPWAGKKTIFCVVTSFSLTEECRKWGCNKMKLLIKKAAEMSWRVGCAHLGAGSHLTLRLRAGSQGDKPMVPAFFGS